jgi:hypothetical protein
MKIVLACLTAMVPLTLAASQSATAAYQGAAPAEWVEKCTAVISTMLSYPQHPVPPAAIDDEKSSLQLACIVANMPDDWGRRQKAMEAAMEHYLAARRVDPDFPKPDFSWKYDIGLPR